MHVCVFASCTRNTTNCVAKLVGPVRERRGRALFQIYKINYYPIANGLYNNNMIIVLVKIRRKRRSEGVGVGEYGHDGRRER